MMAYLQKRNWRMIRNKLKIIGSPVTAKELGVKANHIIDALTIAHKIRIKRFTVLGKEGLSRTAAENLAKKTGVID
jgi:glycerol-1-phosphate dehydrogenase [NAD(P)+]